MAGDWIKLHRRMLDSQIMRKDWPCRLWIWCLLKANYQQRECFGIALKPGQFVTGRFSGAEELNVSPSKFWRGLKLLEKISCLVLKSDSVRTTVTICNWQTYQCNENEIGQRADSERTASGQRMNTTKECKKERSNNPLPPSGGVSVFCQSFEDFWRVYPNSERKSDALREWEKIAPDADLAKLILAAVCEKKQTPQWTRNDGGSVPMAWKWLKRGGWNEMKHRKKVEEEKQITAEELERQRRHFMGDKLYEQTYGGKNGKL